MFVSRNIIKWVLFLILNFSLCTQSFADHYRVTAPNGLNVRASANKNGKLLGQLSKDNVIDVVSIENGWANINYNGWQGYVSASYLEAVTETDEAGTSTKEESWDLTSWLFDSEGESAWFTAIKWILFLGIAIYIIKIVLQFFALMLVVGLIVGAIGLAVGFILDWLGWIDSGTMWDMAQWGFSIGNGIGLIMGILGFKDLHKGATESWSGSSSSSSSGLKTASFTDSGTLGIYNQLNTRYMKNLFKMYRDWRNRKFVEKIDKLYFHKDKQGNRFMKGTLLVVYDNKTGAYGNVMACLEEDLDKTLSKVSQIRIQLQKEMKHYHDIKSKLTYGS